MTIMARGCQLRLLEKKSLGNYRDVLSVNMDPGDWKVVRI